MGNLERLGFVTYPGQVAGTIIVGHPRYWRWETTVNAVAADHALDGAVIDYEAIGSLNRLPMILPRPANVAAAEMDITAMGRKVIWQ